MQAMVKKKSLRTREKNEEQLEEEGEGKDNLLKDEVK